MLNTNATFNGSGHKLHQNIQNEFHHHIEKAQHVFLNPVFHISSDALPSTKEFNEFVRHLVLANLLEGPEKSDSPQNFGPDGASSTMPAGDDPMRTSKPLDADFIKRFSLSADEGHRLRGPPTHFENEPDEQTCGSKHANPLDILEAVREENRETRRMMIRQFEMLQTEKNEAQYIVHTFCEASKVLIGWITQMECILKRFDILQEENNQLREILKFVGDAKSRHSQFIERGYENINILSNDRPEVTTT